MAKIQPCEPPQERRLDDCAEFDHITCKARKYTMAPKSYTPEVGNKILELLTGGMSVLAISRLEGMPTEGTIRNWAWNPEYSNQDFIANYARAREMGADHEFDRLEELEDQLEAGKLDPHAARVLIDSIKWRLSKKMPRLYGDRQHVEHSGEVKVAPKDHAPEWMVERLAAN